MASVSCISGLLVNQVEDDNKEDFELPVELVRLLEHEEKDISLTKNSRSYQPGF